MRHILTGPIASTIYHAAPPDPNAEPIESTPADFSSLGGGKSDDDPLITVTHEEPAKVKETVAPIIEPKKEEKKDEPAKPEKKQADHAPAPEIKKKDEPAKPEKKEEVKPEVKKEEKKDEKPHETPDDDKDLDSIRAKENAPEGIKRAVDELKGKVKMEREAARRYRTELATIKAEKAEVEKKVGTIPEDTTKELEELRSFRLMIELEGDPKFKAEHEAKVTNTETQLFEFLKANGLDDKIAEEIKAAGVTNWKGWSELEKLWQNPLDRQEMINLLTQRRDVDRDRERKISEIKKDKDGYIKQRQEDAKGETVNWSKKANDAVNKLGALEKHEWATIKKVPADATPEQKKAIETHNDRATNLAKSISEILPKMYDRDPDVMMDRLLEATRAELLDKEIETYKSEIEAKDTRIAELEEKIAGIRKAGNVTHSDHAQVVPQKAAPIVEGTGEQALSQFMKERGKE